MTVDARTLGENLWLLMVVLCLVVGGGVTLLVGSMALKAWLWRRRRSRAEREAYEQTHRPDGRPYPPAAAGLCKGCHQVFSKVYYLPDGQALCPQCYAAAHP